MYFKHTNDQLRCVNIYLYGSQYRSRSTTTPKTVTANINIDNGKLFEVRHRVLKSRFNFFSFKCRAE